MTIKTKQYLGLFGVGLLALVALWIVHPKGSRVNLKLLKIPFEKQFKVNLGLDLQGGSHLVYLADFKSIPDSDKPEALNGIRDVIERRVNSFGVSEPLVAISGSDKIIVELPGIKDVNEAIKLIGETPRLEFRTQNPEQKSLTPDKNGNVNINPLEAWLPTKLSGKQLKRATVDFQRNSGLVNQVVVSLEFNDEGKELFAKITSENLQKPVAIILDGEIISAPTVQSAITDGKAVISGNFTTDQAKLLVRRLNSGALPVPIELISQQNIGASLGKISVHKSLIAGFIGLFTVIFFMIGYYRFPGFLASISLLIYTLLAFAVFKIGISFTAVILVGFFFFLALTVNPKFGILALISYLGLAISGGVSPVTLTLAGIAGFILSVGMAVDANILIFERLREEIRSGKVIEKALDDGFNRAWLSIRDSNVSSLITCLILYLYGTPAIKGFAVTLSIGILFSMFTAITITKLFLKLFITNKFFSRSWLFGVKMNK